MNMTFSKLDTSYKSDKKQSKLEKLNKLQFLNRNIYSNRSLIMDKDLELGSNPSLAKLVRENFKVTGINNGLSDQFNEYGLRKLNLNVDYRQYPFDSKKYKIIKLRSTS